MLFINKVLVSSALAITSFYSIASEIKITDKDFKCLTEMTPVRGFFVDNLLGNIKDTVAAAKAKKGSIYPVGSVVQLIPTEVMVKREKGFNQVTKDWEFFELNVNEKGSKINVRGAFEVVNKFGDNCFACHVKAKPQWDMICESTHGCDPIILPNGEKVSRKFINSIQQADPRCTINKKPATNDAQ